MAFEEIKMNDRMKDFYITLAEDCSRMSRAERLKVGCVVVKDDNIISFSWNGTPAGWDNRCEEKEWMNTDVMAHLSIQEIESQWPYVEYSDYDDSVIGRYRLKTKPEVIHAERNALDKLARGKESGKGSTMFITHAPCIECAKSIYGAGIHRVYYKNNYKSDNGIEFLKKCNIHVEKL